MNKIIKSVNWEEKQSGDWAQRKGTDSAKWQQTCDTRSKLYSLLVNRSKVSKEIFFSQEEQRDQLSNTAEVDQP